MRARYSRYSVDLFGILLCLRTKPDLAIPKSDFLSSSASLSSLPSALRCRRSLYKFHESFEPYIFSLSSRFARHVLLKYDNFTRRSLHPRFVCLLLLFRPGLTTQTASLFPLFHGFGRPTIFRFPSCPPKKRGGNYLRIGFRVEMDSSWFDTFLTA